MSIPLHYPPMHETGPLPIRLFDSFGILPRVIRFFLLEKGIEIPRHEVDLLLGENRDPEYLKLNPSGQTPALELSDGTILGEGPVICEYLEDLFPDPPLIGTTSKERAITRMWWRRAELNICQPMILGFYYGEGFETYRTRMRCLPEAAAGMKERARDGMRWMDGLLRGEWVAGPPFTIADIHLYCFIEELTQKGQSVPDECHALKSWMERVGSRPAAETSLGRWRSAGTAAVERPRLSS
jgi:glutathione S-transferase